MLMWQAEQYAEDELRAVELYVQDDLTSFGKGFTVIEKVAAPDAGCFVLIPGQPWPAGHHCSPPWLAAAALPAEHLWPETPGCCRCSDTPLCGLAGAMLVSCLLMHPREL